MWLPEFFQRLESVFVCDDLDDDSIWDWAYKNCSDNATAITPEWINGTDGPNLDFYLDTLYVSLASLLGIIAGILLIPIVGGRTLVCK